MEPDAETRFFTGLIELSYGRDIKSKLKKLAGEINWTKGWPEDKIAFWNAEAFMWQRKIDKNKRELIKLELQFLEGNNNLDIGCGSYSYVSSVGLDFSEKMLLFNDNCSDKVNGDLEQKLPFDNQAFDSVTAVFVLNYVKNYKNLLLEIKRVLKKNGVFIMVLSAKKINKWQRQKEVNCFNFKRWIGFLESYGFNVNFYEKNKLCFFKCIVF